MVDSSSVPSDVSSEAIEYKDFQIQQTYLMCESEILILEYVRMTHPDEQKQERIPSPRISASCSPATAHKKKGGPQNYEKGLKGTAFFKRFRKKATRLCAEMIYAQEHNIAESTNL